MSSSAPHPDSQSWNDRVHGMPTLMSEPENYEPDIVPGTEEDIIRKEKMKPRLRDLIEEDRSPYKYSCFCDRCNTEMGVNMMGMGACPSCGYNRNPLIDS